MGLPAKRTTNSKRDMRRSHHALSAIVTGNCPKCSNPILAHRACTHCGFYRGREAVNVLVKLDKKERKKREKELAQQEKSKDKGGAKKEEKESS